VVFSNLAFLGKIYTLKPTIYLFLSLMQKPIIIFYSLEGFTKRIAQYIAKETK